MILAEKISISFQGTYLFQDLSLTLQKGEKCALIGRNGSGKTTLLKILIGKETPDSGKVLLPKGYKLGYLEQHIRFSQSTVLLEAVNSLPLKDEETYKAEAILFGLGFDEEKLNGPPHLLSGGFALRLNLAKVLLSEPDCLLLDEPTNYLDIPAIHWLSKFLKNWTGELVIISHDREFLDEISTHTMCIHRRQFFKIKGTTQDLYTQIALDEETYERSREKTEKMKAHAQDFIDRFGAKATKAAQARSRQKMIEKIPALTKLTKLYDLEFSFQSAAFHSHKMVQINNVSFSYPKTTSTLIDDFSITIEKKKRIAIIGKNGFGKSTLLRLINTDLTPLSGTVIQNENTSIGYFGQTNINRLNPEHTVEQEIASANPDLSITEIYSICGKMMFSKEQAEKKISVLSGGEKSRVLLGKILAKRCNLLLLDEPTHHLDIESIEALMDAIDRFEGSVVLVTHSELILHRLKTDLIVLCHKNSQKLFEGTYEEFLEKIGWPEEEVKIKQVKAPTLQSPLSRLKPLQNKLRQLENEIRILEEKIRWGQDHLTELAQVGKSDIEVARKLQSQENSLRDLYSQWEQISLDLEALKSPPS